MLSKRQLKLGIVRIAELEVRSVRIYVVCDAVAPNQNVPTTIPRKRTGDGAAGDGDRTIVRPAAAAPPRRLERVEPVGRHRAAQPRARDQSA